MAASPDSVRILHLWQSRKNRYRSGTAYLIANKLPLFTHRSFGAQIKKTYIEIMELVYTES